MFSSILGLKINKTTIPTPFSLCFLITFIPATYAQNISFETQVLPILETKCGECHGSNNPEVRLNLTTYVGLIEGSEYGLVVEPGDVMASYLIEMIETGEMPQDGEPVSSTELTVIRSWIEQGALNN